MENYQEKESSCSEQITLRMLYVLIKTQFKEQSEWINERFGPAEPPIADLSENSQAPVKQHEKLLNILPPVPAKFVSPLVVSKKLSSHKHLPAEKNKKRRKKRHHLVVLHVRYKHLICRIHSSYTKIPTQTQPAVRMDNIWTTKFKMPFDPRELNFKTRKKNDLDPLSTFPDSTWTCGFVLVCASISTIEWKIECIKIKTI